MLTWLIQTFLACLMTGEAMECAELLNQIVEVNEMVSEEKKEYTIGIVGFPEDSLANEIVNYWYDQSSGNLDMIATFMAENWNFDPQKKSKTNDYGLCMLHWNKTNRRWIEDPRWSDPIYQAEVCLDKWNAVPNPSKVWYGWKNREKMKQRIYFFNQTEWR